MSVVAHHVGEQAILTAAIGSGLLSGSLLVLRVGIADLVRRGWRERR